ncbi:MAG: hypothetical protein JWO72_264 [Caulobacteraceae bacterium]|nr:hypothetical protein [Caulobacteraceae bacterium]
MNIHRRASSRLKLAQATGAACFSIALLAGTALAPTLAAAQDKPPADTPVPAQFQESYKAFLDMKAKAHGGAKHTATDVPDWSGIWTRGPGGLKFDPAQPGAPTEGKVTAVLTPPYRAKYEKKVADLIKGIEWDQLSYCLPAGFPRSLTEPFLREYIVKPDQVWQINEQQSEARRIYTDGRGHVPDDEAFPLWEGDSIGFWDGDALVVHTIRVKPGQYQRAQPDYTDQTSTIERIRKINADTIEDDVTVWDPPALQKPWRVVDTYVRIKSPGARIDMWSCEENNNVVKTENGASTFVLPGESGYKDPSKILTAPK